MSRTRHKRNKTSEIAAKYVGWRSLNPNGLNTTKQRKHSGKKGGVQLVSAIETRWPCRTPKTITKRIYHHPQ